MSTYTVVGADRETGQDKIMALEASSEENARALAGSYGLVVSDIKASPTNALASSQRRWGEGLKTFGLLAMLLGGVSAFFNAVGGGRDSAVIVSMSLMAAGGGISMMIVGVVLLGQAEIIRLLSQR